MQKRLGMSLALAAAAALLSPGAMVGAVNPQVETYQAAAGIPADGRAGPATQAALRRAEEDLAEVLTGIRPAGTRFKLPAAFNLPKHRRPGERAHRRWSRARASGLKNAHRG